MRIRRTYLTTILATPLAAAAAILVPSIASPPNVQLSSAPIHNAPRDDIGGIPNVNGPANIDVPNVDVPDINMPLIAAVLLL